MKKILCLIILFALLSLNVSEIKASEEMTTFCLNDVNLTNIINEVDLLPLHNLSDEHLEKGTLQPSMFCPTGGGFESSAVTVVV